MPPKQEAAAGGGKGGGAKAKERRRLAKLQEQRIKDSKVHVEQGLAFHDKANQLGKAIASYTQAIEVNPENWTAYLWRGRAYRDIKEFDKAISDYTKAIELHPPEAHELALCYAGRANAHECIERYDDAIEDYTQVIELDPEDDHAYNMRGSARQAKRIATLKLSNAEFSTVMGDFSTAIQKNSSNYHAFCNRGVALYDRKRFSEAIEDFTASIGLKWDYTYAYVRRGIAYYDWVMYDEHTAKLRKDEEQLMAAVRGDAEFLPKVPKSLKEQQTMWEQEFRAAEDGERKRKERIVCLENALADFTKAISQTDNESLQQADAGTYIHRAKVHAALGNMEKAAEDNKRAAEIEARIAKARS